MGDYLLLTGATGLLGQYLLRDLLLDNHRVAAILRPTKQECVFQRMETILAHWERELGRNLPRPVCLEGEITSDGLGLDSASRRWVGRNCTRVVHNAAVLAFNGSSREQEPWRTNLAGTGNVLRLCEELGLRDLHYVSTAYVCGTRAGLILESELDCGQNFRNDYEHSKFLAEKLVREATHLDRPTFYRPGVIAGDSRTGFTSTYHGLYLYLRLIEAITRNLEPGQDGVRRTQVRLDMTGDERRNIVPVDWVSNVICKLIGRHDARGGTFHLTPDEPITPRAIVEHACRRLNSTGVEFCGRPNDPNHVERATYENTSIYSSYEISDPAFDTSQLRRLVPELPCPKIDDALLTRYWKFAEEDRWGRRRRPRANISSVLSSELPTLRRGRKLSLESPFGRNRSATERFRMRPSVDCVLGLDLIGPGGGAWTLRSHSPSAVHVDEGLPPRSYPVARVPAEQFHRCSRAEAGQRKRIIARWLAEAKADDERSSGLLQTLMDYLSDSQAGSAGFVARSPAVVPPEPQTSDTCDGVSQES